MPTFKVGDGSDEAVLFVTLQMIVPDWFRVAFMGAIREMTVQNNWFVEGDSTADFARDKSVEMINSIVFSGDNPLPIWKTPIGTVSIFGGETAPTGWLMCFGQSLLRADYADLFAVIGVNFGSDDSTHFTLPDTRERSVVGVNDYFASAYHLNYKAGSEFVTLDISQIPAHTHTTNIQSAAGSAGTNRAQATRAVSGAAYNSGSEGGGDAHENRPPFITLNMMIYAGEG